MMNSYFQNHITDSYTFHDGKLYYVSINGEHEAETRCRKNLGNYKIYAYRVEASLPYTRYIIADKETGKVAIDEIQHYWSGNNPLGQIIEKLEA